MLNKAVNLGATVDAILSYRVWMHLRLLSIPKNLSAHFQHSYSLGTQIREHSIMYRISTSSNMYNVNLNNIMIWEGN